jgi:hypothetical protein
VPNETYKTWRAPKRERIKNIVEVPTQTKDPKTDSELPARKHRELDIDKKMSAKDACSSRSREAKPATSTTP